ncbi:MAG: hypothetical protein ACI30S_00425 [Muribaculaceae bacterium]
MMHHVRLYQPPPLFSILYSLFSILYSLPPSGRLGEHAVMRKDHGKERSDDAWSYAIHLLRGSESHVLWYQFVDKR